MALDITLEAKERSLLEVVGEFGCAPRTLIVKGKAKAGEIDDLCRRGLLERTPRHALKLTHGGRIAIGLEKAPSMREAGQDG